MGAEALAVLFLGLGGLLAVAVLLARVGGVVAELTATAKARKRAASQLQQFCADSERDRQAIEALRKQAITDTAARLEFERSLHKRLGAIENDLADSREDITGLRKYVEGEERGILSTLSRLGRTPRA